MLKVGEITYDGWVDCRIKCVEDTPGTNSCSMCVFGEDGASCPERVYDLYPCYCSDRDDNKNVHYERTK